MKLIFKIIFIAFISTAILIVGCDISQEPVQVKFDKRVSNSELDKLLNVHNEQHGKSFLFGFDLRSSPQEDARQYLPFLKYMENKTGYKFKLRFTPQDGKIVDDLGTGVVQFAAIGAVSYIQAVDQYGVKPMVRGLNSKNKAEYRSMIIVPLNSKVQKLSDLKGKRFAFGGKTSTQGHLIPRIILSKNKIKLSDFSEYDFMGSHQKCADAILSGNFDACGLQDTMALDLERKKIVRIIYRSNYYPSSGISASKDIAEDVFIKVRQSMLDFQPKTAKDLNLYNWDKTEMPNGFAIARNKDYAILRTWLSKLNLNDKKESATKLGNHK